MFEGPYLRPALKATPEPKVEVLGGTERFAFVGVPTAKAYFTVILAINPFKKLRVIDALPSTPLQPATKGVPPSDSL